MLIMTRTKMNSKGAMKKKISRNYFIFLVTNIRILGELEGMGMQRNQNDQLADQGKWCIEKRRRLLDYAPFEFHTIIDGERSTRRIGY